MENNLWNMSLKCTLGGVRIQHFSNHQQKWLHLFCVGTEFGKTFLGVLVINQSTQIMLPASWLLYIIGTKKLHLSPYNSFGTLTNQEWTNDGNWHKQTNKTIATSFELKVLFLKHLDQNDLFPIHIEILWTARGRSLKGVCVVCCSECIFLLLQQ